VSQRIVSNHSFHVAAPIAQCQRFFTPAGEERWVDGWSPSYIHPVDGHTEVGMVFTTGQGDEFTIWSLVDFDPHSHYARYSRVTPALRSSLVEIFCSAESAELTRVGVRYTLTALTEPGQVSLSAFQGRAFAQMIDGWRAAIEARLPQLLSAQIA
jgi:hypothetical protein